ncbi:MAG: CoA ester lyase [Phenylobacterium sp.]|uniref:HpcH/HpaI aldolase/citrate lyase family protein n=1 Tax=Phenylobacterium sp. TaxID=1871053 RepID=UPI0027327139|nr:CoA ester lyase [Phenylobacterium sp.]MDP3746549.1 CoA ester lyase [Phenylobacterium sp.]
MSQARPVPISPLFVPGDRPERFAKAARSGADAIIIDLEDAVSPDRKDLARASLTAAFTSLPVYVRINGAQTPWRDLDLAAVQANAFAGVILPKAEADGFARLPSGLRVVALIESAAGLASAREIARHPQVERLAFGSIDYCADLGCAHTQTALLAARCEIVLASRLAGIAPPLDGVTLALDDGALARHDACHAVDLGFGGKLCIHPRQVAFVREGFAPSADDIAWARRIVSTNDAVGKIAGEMVDPPVRLRAEQVLRRAAALDEPS